MNLLKQLFLVGLMLASGAASAAEVSPEQALVIRQAVVGWLECEECTEGQLRNVVALGQMAVPSLGAALQRGPSPASLEKVRIRLESTHRALVEYARTHSEVRLPLRETDYVKLYLDNYRASYGVRAAQALNRIGGSAAKAHLAAAEKLPLRADVLAAVKSGAMR